VDPNSKFLARKHFPAQMPAHIYSEQQILHHKVYFQSPLGFCVQGGDPTGTGTGK
jgi:hypothetical protein